MTLVPALDLRGAEPEDTPATIAVEIEQSLLGILMYDNAAFERLPDHLCGEHFLEPFHGRLFDEIAHDIRIGKLAEPILLAERFKADGAFLQLGGVRYLADLYERAPPSAHARDYGVEIIETAGRRELERMGAEMAKVAQDPRAGTLREKVEAYEARLYALAEPAGKGALNGFVSFESALAGAVQMAAEAYSRDGGLAGLSTGLIDLDQKLGGLHPSDLLIIAGRPSMGKTALAVNIAYHVARQYAYELQPDGSRKTTAGGIVGFFSLEMSAEQLGMRLLADVSGVSSDRLRKGEIAAHEFGQVRDAAIEIQGCPLHIDPTGGISLAKLAARARRLKRQHGLDLIVIDYLQLVTTEGTKHDNRVNEVSQITGGLKALAKDLNVPVIALSQLSRQVENREDKKPQLSDLRESGSIEQDADAVMFVYREAYYLGRMEPREGTPEHLDWRAKMDEVEHLAEIIIGKQRHGPIGSVKLAFNPDLTRFGNLARNHGFGGPKP